MPVLLASNSPHIYKADFDNEAVEFLQLYYPEALERPLAVPIADVARHRMGLRIVERRLTEDFSILGQMCFTSGLAEIYDKENDEYKEVKARYGTMIIDPDTINKRNEGCKNNTIAHECFHWHKHRDYHIAKSVRDPKKAISRLCPYEGKDEATQTTWTDEEWMEWQARGIAPRILMPHDPFCAKVEDLLARYSSSPEIRKKWVSLHGWVVNSVSAFFKVSKESAAIRLDETGFYLRGYI